MAFTVSDFHDLVTVLEDHPEWRAELRRVLLTEELLALPQIVRDIATTLDRTETLVQELVEAQRRTEARLDRMDARFDRVDTHLEILQTHVGDLRGAEYERRYRENAVAYFGRIVRHPHVLTSDEKARFLQDAVDRDLLSVNDGQAIALADAIIRGQLQSDRSEAYLVVEISAGVGPSDVRRAVDRAALLGRAGVTAIPVVAGDSLTAEAQQDAQHERVWQVAGGGVVAPDAA
jgi:hypothetical protein